MEYGERITASSLANSERECESVIKRALDSKSEYNWEVFSEYSKKLFNMAAVPAEKPGINTMTLKAFLNYGDGTGRDVGLGGYAFNVSVDDGSGAPRVAYVSLRQHTTGGTYF
ncbi:MULTISPECIES: hypothetical protein [Pseudomonas]|uniref:Uncharacterized protein n=1 Tax=Pseudomonas triticicola TaxID=2842345 RepID=A0ABS6RNC2_9PSED|nr:hypothetical protein [Pseudomonas triticicola]MBV4547676.1 hypothetical protein [Pseudomonas triticicola]